MSFAFMDLLPRRDGIVLSVELKGMLPNPCHRIVSASGRMDRGGRIVVTVTTKNVGGVCAQVISRVSQVIDPGRTGPGDSDFTIVADGKEIRHGRISH